MNDKVINPVYGAVPAVNVIEREEPSKGKVVPDQIRALDAYHVTHKSSRTPSSEHKYGGPQSS
jgi:hypothetical protein